MMMVDGEMQQCTKDALACRNWAASAICTATRGLSHQPRMHTTLSRVCVGGMAATWVRPLCLSCIQVQLHACQVQRHQRA